jgi:phosphoglycolate phosphatase
MTTQQNAALFLDLDGTLIDSLPGIETAAAKAVAEVVPQATLIADVRRCVGPPLNIMFRRMLGELGTEIENKLVIAYRQIYYEQEKIYGHTPLYEGVQETLLRMNENGVSCFIVTNKSWQGAQCVLEATAILPLLTEVMCRDKQDPPFGSKQEMTAHLIEKYQIGPETSCFVGDSEDDALAAQSCGIPFAAASYGYGAVHEKYPYQYCLTKFPQILQAFPSLP